MERTVVSAAWGLVMRWEGGEVEVVEVVLFNKGAVR